ncbi:MAG: glycosyltransferase [Chroococcidiopsidaceae cyanobacterium CP_BM_RX_35]|nr:glycosyltransferase [Chroococcidiopsidaceae cyanobacterium CP_BM_RX_35]
MLFDLAIGGHHGNYIQHLLEYWCENQLPGNIDIVTLPEFLQVHYDVVNFISKVQNSNINLVPITKEESVALATKTSSLERVLRNFQEWRLLCKYAVHLKASECLLMYFDTYKVPLALGLRAPCPFSGIYFRPTFHYNNFVNYIPFFKEVVQQRREQLMLVRVLRHPQLSKLFCLDPFATECIEQLYNQPHVVYLPDPVRLEDRSQLSPTALKDKLRVQSHRKVFLLFGGLEGRKGIYQLIDAIALLPPTLCEKLCLVLAGGTNSTEQALITTKVKEILQTCPVQIIERYEFLSETVVPTYFQLADVVLAPYQSHVGMSGILLQAAAAGKPVLSSDYGLMGELVLRHQLGLAIDSTKPQEIAKGLKQFLEASKPLCDHTKMQAFAEQHSAQHFARIIFQHLLASANCLNSV